MPNISHMQIGLDKVRLFLFIMFVGIPILEIAAFMQIGALIGPVPTLLGILLTAIIGAWLVRWQGFKVAMDAKQSLEQGDLPVEALMHGVCILAAGILLLTPGYVTDSIGFLLLIPRLRLFIARIVMESFKGKAEFHMATPGTTPGKGGNSSRYQRSDGVIIDGEAQDITDIESGPPNAGSPWHDKS